MGMLAPKCPQQSQLVTLQTVDTRRAVFGAADIDGRGIEVDLLPADIDQLAHPQGMPERHENQQPREPSCDLRRHWPSACRSLVPSGIRAVDIRCSLPDHRELSTFQTARAVIGQPYSLANSPFEQINCRHNAYIGDSCEALLWESRGNRTRGAGNLETRRRALVALG
jgi:hypothetical protein